MIVPDLTWIATAAPIHYVGATPVFADIDPQTWCLSTSAFERCITPKTKAVIAVHLYGNMVDMEALNAVADAHGIAVIEDAAQAIGSEFHGAKAGSIGRLGAFSFHGSKTLTTGEGGMFVTQHEDLYHRALLLRDHGRSPGDTTFLNHEVAFKYKMSAMQAALGLAQLERIETLLACKRRIFSLYAEALQNIDGLYLNTEPLGTKNSFWMVTLRLDPHFGLNKFDLMDHLFKRSIDTRPCFSPLSSLPAYAGTPSAEAARKRNRESYRLSSWAVNLPSGSSLRADHVHYVCDQLIHILRSKA